MKVAVALIAGTAQARVKEFCPLKQVPCKFPCTLTKRKLKYFIQPTTSAFAALPACGSARASAPMALANCTWIASVARCMGATGTISGAGALKIIQLRSRPPPAPQQRAQRQVRLRHQLQRQTTSSITPMMSVICQ